MKKKTSARTRKLALNRVVLTQIPGAIGHRTSFRCHVTDVVTICHEQTCDACPTQEMCSYYYAC